MRLHVLGRKEIDVMDMARKSILREWGLDKPNLKREDVIKWLRKTHTVPQWNNNYGLVFKPHIGARTRERLRELLQINTKQDLEALKREIYAKQKD